MGESPKDEMLQDATENASTIERRKEFTRRVLLQAGWVVPLVTTVNIPSALAQSVVPAHTDHTDHTDLPHDDVAPHSDALPHTDVPHSDHSDVPHQDHQDHQDSHVDSHVDAHGDEGSHSDVPHVDASTAR